MLPVEKLVFGLNNSMLPVEKLVFGLNNSMVPVKYSSLG